MHRFAPLLALGVLAATASAQLTHVLPNGTATTEGNSSNAFPWGRGSAASLQIQTIYDSSNFTAASISYPIVISRLRYRLNGNAVNNTAAVYTQATVDMASAAVDALSPTTSFAANMGPDQAQVYSGPVNVNVVAASTPGSFSWVDIPLTTNFVYDPSTGNDLVIFTDIPPAVGTGVPALQLDVQTTGSLSSRVYNSTAYGSGTGTIGTNHGVVVEVSYVPAAGLYPSFSATPTRGASPLMVQFTDTSYSSDPGGVLAWMWDLDGDGVTDSTAQNPTFNYGCGSFNVSLTVVDATHGPQTVVRNGFIVTDEHTAGFTWQHTGGGLVQFTDTTTPTPQSWAWDFNGDTIVDSTLQNPTATFPIDCTGSAVTLTTTLNCKTSSAGQTVALAPTTQTGLTAGGNGTSGATDVGNMFEMQVTAPEGITICGVDCTPYSFSGPYNVAVYVTDGTYVGKDTNASAWRLAGTGSGVSTGAGFNPPTLHFSALSPFYLPAGNYGMAVYLSRVPASTTNIAYTNGPQGPIVGPDMTLFPNPTTAPGIVRTGLFGGGTINSRCWNGVIHYTKTSLTNTGGYGFFAPGCPGSLGVSHLTPNARPALGSTLSVTADNVPMNAAINVLGFSNTTSAFGPLPLDLTPFGAPSCFARVRDDSTLFLGGAGNTVTWSLSIPNNPALLAGRAFQQMFLLDTGFNSLGVVTTDAAGFILGQ